MDGTLETRMAVTGGKIFMVLSTMNCLIAQVPSWAKKFLAILLVTFLGWWKRDPFKGCWWPPIRGSKGHGLNHLVEISISVYQTH